MGPRRVSRESFGRVSREAFHASSLPRHPRALQCVHACTGNQGETAEGYRSDSHCARAVWPLRRANRAGVLPKPFSARPQAYVCVMHRQTVTTPHFYLSLCVHACRPTTCVLNAQPALCLCSTLGKTRGRWRAHGDASFLNLIHTSRCTRAHTPAQDMHCREAGCRGRRSKGRAGSTGLTREGVGAEFKQHLYGFVVAALRRIVHG
jgi:hypothetical protein